MSFGHLLKYALTLDPGTAAAKGIRFGKAALLGTVEGFRGKHVSSFAAASPPSENVFETLVSTIDVAAIVTITEPLVGLAENHLAHRFDLLGSGWRTVEYGSDCLGFEGHRYGPHDSSRDREALLCRLNPGNRPRAEEIRNLINPGYPPIDWQLDFKSGYRWREDRHWRSIRYGHVPGADIKVPWELARLQHLPQLALAHALAATERPEFRAPETYANEIRDQILDFLAANPPGYGVNWACAMDVAIRAANIVVACDLLRAGGAPLDGPAAAEIAAGLRAHGRHIIANLEWHETRRANHYLADITGLLFIAAFLPGNEETDAWLAFAASQILAEIERQFHPDGANFEASTGYHRLSAEMALYGTAVILGLKEDRKQALQKTRIDPKLLPAGLAGIAGDFREISEQVRERLEGMAEFCRAVTKPDGSVVQIGDADNGRFFKICPAHYSPELEENHRDQRSIVAVAGALFGRADLTEFAGPGFSLEAKTVSAICRGATLSPPSTSQRESTVSRDLSTHEARRSREIVVELPHSLVMDELETFAFADFGLFIWKAEGFFLSIRCGEIGHDGSGAHAHNDQLAVELQIDGIDWLADPGSYVYTAAPTLRNAYRSADAHAVPRLSNDEPSPLVHGPFRLDDTARAECLRFDLEVFHGVHHAFDEPVFRMVRLEPERITIIDGIGGTVPGKEFEDRKSVTTGEELRQAFGLTLPFSPGYGSRN